jgi:transcriptional regulator with XRE-family HTH domain
LSEKEIRQILSFNIKLYRQRKGLSQAKVAEKMDISTCYLSDIENCRGWVSPSSLSKLAHALGIEVYELFKPTKSKQKDVSTMVNQCLDDVANSIKTSVEKSIDDTIKKIRKGY